MLLTYLALKKTKEQFESDELQVGMFIPAGIIVGHILMLALALYLGYYCNSKSNMIIRVLAS